KDYTYQILKDLHANIFVHGVNIKPGKPTIFAMLNQKLFVGLPGQPTSAYMVLNTFFPTIDKAIHHLKTPLYEPYVEGIITHNVSGAQGRKTFQLVTINGTSPIQVTPLFAKSGMITSLSKAYGYIIIESGEEGLLKGEVVKVYRLGD
ncbi:MAG: molybdopterin-binding protein, partial [Bacillota bacterium]